jgi:uncharacterized membrane protein YphA (DoxX/SURF4 family)
MTAQSIDQPPRYLVPALGGFYAVLSPYSWPLVRVATGLFFVPHGMQKLFGFWGGDLTRTAEGFAKQGLCPCSRSWVARNPPMTEPRNKVVQVKRFGGPDGLEVVDAPLPTAGRGEVLRPRARLGSGVH